MPDGHRIGLVRDRMLCEDLMDIEGVHKCDERCHCPSHQLMMYHHKASNSHACQNPECEYASGYENALIQRSYRRWYR